MTTQRFIVTLEIEADAIPTAAAVHAALQSKLHVPSGRGTIIHVLNETELFDRMDEMDLDIEELAP